MVPQAVRDAAGEVKIRGKKVKYQITLFTILNVIIKAKELGNKLADASARGDSKGVDQALRDLKDTEGTLSSPFSLLMRVCRSFDCQSPRSSSSTST